MKRMLAFLMGLVLLVVAQVAMAVTDTFVVSGTWTAPVGVTSVSVEVWGGGGAGGGNPTNQDGAGGGGGGGYSRSTITVVPGNNYTVTVGAGGIAVDQNSGGPGGDSWFSTAGTILAKGGTGGNPPAGGAGGIAGVGGAAAAGIGTTKFSGGNGGTGRDSNTGRGGPGGSSAGTAANGTSGPVTWATATAATAPAGGGIGGNGGNANREDGFAPASGNGGGGGGGAERQTMGGNGNGGKVAITYTPPPTVTSINCVGSCTTNAGSISWLVTFSASVAGGSSSNFTLVNSGLGGTPAITSVTGSGATRTVTASTGTGSGTLGLNMVNTTGVTPALAGLPFTGQVYTIDRTAPVVSSITRVNPSPTALASVSWTVTFSKTVTGVDATDFALVQAGGVTGAAITGVTPVSGLIYTVTAGTGTGNGTLGLNLTDNDSVVDTLANPLGGTGAGNGDFSGEVYVISKPVTVTANPTLCVNDASIGVPTGSWTGLTNVATQNNIYAQASVANSDITNYLKCTGYGFSIPAGATITGITVGPWLNASFTMIDNAMQLVKGGAIQATNLATGANIPNGGGAFAASPTQFIYGSSTNLWGNTWTAADINSANFGAAFAAQRGGFASTQQAGVDAMPITIDYTLPAFPTVSSINLASTNPTNPNTSVNWTVTFNQSVTGVDASDFLLVLGGGVTGAAITGVTGGGTTWTVTANTGSGIGTLGLDLVDDDTIVAGADKLGGTGVGNGNFTGQVYTVSPVLTCITDNFTAADNSAPDTASWNAGKITGTFTPVIFGNRLRITDISGNAATRATNKNLFPFGNNLVIAEFDYWAYGGSGADGIAVTFSDPDTPTPGANNPPTTGGFGGSLGYANRDTGGVCNTPGFSGGWIGIGIDEYGNYSNPNECRNGGPGFTVNAVAMRGSGSGATSPSTSNYAYVTGTAALGVNGVSSGAAGAPYRYRITLDSITDLAKVMIKVEQDKTGGGYLPLFSYDLKPLITAGTQAPLPPRLQLTFTGSTGGSTNYHEVDNLSICAAAVIPASGPHHLEIQHASGSEVTCNPTTLTIKACADNLVPCTPYTGGVTGTLSATGTPTVNWDGTTGGAAGAGFDIPNGSSSVTKNVQVTTLGTTVFDAVATPAATNVTTCNFGTPSCTFTATDSAFIITAPDHAAESTSTLTIQAVKAVPGNPLLCTTGMTGAKTVNLKCSYTNPASGTLPVRVGGTPLAANAASACSVGGVNVPLTFDASGVATPTLQYADVGEMLISATFTGTPGSIDAGLVLAGSDTFIAAPAAFDFSAVTAGTIKAGDPFSATVRALNAAGAVAHNFGKEAEGVTLTSTLVTPDPGTYPSASNPAPGNNVIPGTEFGTGGMVSDANGVASVNNLNWGEVGSITLTANLTSGSYLGSGLTASGTSATVGPFIPHHFDTVVATTTSLPMPCPSGTCPVSNSTQDGFIYSGQPFSVQVFARNLAGSTTANYDGTFGLSKAVTLTAWDAKGGTTQNPGSGTLGSNAVAAAAFISGVATLTDTPTYTFATSPTAPTDIYVRAVDADGVTSLRTIPLNSIEGGVQVASGRVKIGNAHGSELLPLPMTAIVQYYNGTDWVSSVTDSVTSLTLALSNYQYKSGAWTTTPTPAGGQVIAGVLPFNLSKPSGGGTGSVDVSIGAPNYLLTGSNSAALNPSKPGRATFGVYKGNNEFIYLRETY